MLSYRSRARIHSCARPAASLSGSAAISRNIAGAGLGVFSPSSTLRQPHLRLAVVDRKDQTKHLCRRIDRIDVGAAVAQVDGAPRLDIPELRYA